MAYISTGKYIGAFAYERMFCGIMPIMDVAIVFLVSLALANTIFIIIILSVFSIFTSWMLVKFNRSLIETSVLLAQMIDLVKISKQILARLE